MVFKKIPRVALPPVVFVRAVLRSFMKESGLEPRLFGASNIRVINAIHGRVQFELDITKDHTNRLGMLHGGTIASMVDLGGSLAVASTGLYATGVSTDLNVSYLSSGGDPGKKITATAICDKIGKTLAYTSVTFRNHEDKLAARGSHTKYVERAIRAQHELFFPPRGVEIEIEDFDGLEDISAISLKDDLSDKEPDTDDTPPEAEDKKS
ncbi:HotDog domain-containing protein [Xylaria flabelliformis]|nr:HotDog domain-containing protein [Xylaria flabelliformis]